MSDHDDPARSFLDETLPPAESWIDPSRPRRVEQAPVTEPGTWRKAMPVVSGLLFAAWTVEAFTDLG
ncbi:hypothetical protein [Labedaea rhizosphaerae]|uniref:Uncharacterized protein n=1 Tax=Labedaea rhizosphaerae TaxID=598644 RepID=A0A4R6SBY9_LABRH|nr:hypothetical protein [Labedaea rhizosphaerae]TDP96415.1 hypothetical protein EV186_104402 [Labedaea rhizosphaerae]